MQLRVEHYSVPVYSSRWTRKQSTAVPTTDDGNLLGCHQDRQPNGHSISACENHTRHLIVIGFSSSFLDKTRTTGPIKLLHIHVRQARRSAPAGRLTSGRGNPHTRSVLDVYPSGDTAEWFSHQSGWCSECRLDVSVQSHSYCDAGRCAFNDANMLANGCNV